VGGVDKIYIRYSSTSIEGLLCMRCWILRNNLRRVAIARGAQLKIDLDIDVGKLLKEDNIV
jgi:hypothetical protein